MKRLLSAVFLLAALAGSAWADTVQVDDTFEKTNKWLNDSNLTLTGSPSGQRDDNSAFSQEALLFFGEAVGNPDHRTQAQREQMAKRAAVVMAQRALTEYLEGFALVGDTSVKDGMAQYDVVRSAVSGFVKGSQVVFQEFSKEKDTAIAIIKHGLHGPKGFASAVYEKMFKDPELKKSLTEVDGKQAPQYKPKAAAAVESYDCLIIDATEQNFKPALINRIFNSANELLYDPSKVSQKVLVEQGCGEYTNSVDKAKAVLELRGAKKPLVVKAVGTVSSADLKVSDEDALKIFSANQKENFLAGAKVAFVLN